MAELPDRIPDEMLAQIRAYLEGCKGAELADIPPGLERYERWLTDADGRAVMLLAEVDRLTMALEIMSKLHMEAEQQVGALLAERDEKEADRG